jgi:hypothetical protein
MYNSETECDMLPEGAAAAYLGEVPEGTMRQWRYLGKGPAYVKIGRHVRYRRADLDAFIAAQRVDPGAT